MSLDCDEEVRALPYMKRDVGGVSSLVVMMRDGDERPWWFDRLAVEKNHVV